MRRRFNELLDDTFSLFGTSKETAEPSIYGANATSAKSGERGHSAIVRYVSKKLCTLQPWKYEPYNKMNVLILFTLGPLNKSSINNFEKCQYVLDHQQEILRCQNLVRKHQTLEGWHRHQA